MLYWLRCWFQRQHVDAALGLRGEGLAEKFLRDLGYRIIERQLRSRYGELDLVALDAETVVFVEVKTRSSTLAGDPTEAITLAKQRKMTQSALAYLKRRGWLNRRARFDVIAILWHDDQPPELKHYQNAFEATGFGQMY